MPKVTQRKRAPLLDKLEKGGGFSAPVRVSPPSDFNSAKVYNDANRALGKGFALMIDMIEEVFDVKLSRTKKKHRGKAKLF